MGESLGVGGKLILAFITLLLGAVLVAQVATTSIAVTTLTGIPSETITFTPLSSTDMDVTEVLTLTNAPTGWKAQDGDCYTSNFALVNGSGTYAIVTTDYVLTASAGTFTLANSTWNIQNIGGANTTTASYDYCGDDYMALDWGRTAINLVSGFFALAILGASLALFYSVGKDTGII